MNKFFLPLTLGGAGLAAGTGVLAPVLISSKEVKNTQNKNILPSFEEEIKKPLGSNDYQNLEEKLKEIEKMGESADISWEIKELEKILEEVPGKLLEELEIKLAAQINKFNWSEKADKRKLFSFLDKIAQKLKEYQEKNKEGTEEI